VALAARASTIQPHPQVGGLADPVPSARRLHVPIAEDASKRLNFFSLIDAIHTERQEDRRFFRRINFQTLHIAAIMSTPIPERVVTLSFLDLSKTSKLLELIGSDLIRHYETKHSAKRQEFICPHCEDRKSFSRSDALR